MVKLLIRDFVNTKAQKNHTCDSCGLGIQKGRFYKKFQSPNFNQVVKLHTGCFTNLSLDLSIKLLENLKY